MYSGLGVSAPIPDEASPQKCLRRLKTGRRSKAFFMRNLLAASRDSSVHRRRWIHFLIGFFFLASVGRSAVAVDPLPATQYIRTDFTVDDGLPDNTINVITQTENGLLWVGTGSGLATFDGRTFTTVHLRIPGTPIPSRVSSLVAGPDGDLWVGSDAGVIRIPNRDLNSPALPHSTAFRLGNQRSDEVQVLFKDREGTIWAGTNHGLYRFDGSRFVCMDGTISVGRISQAVDGRLLLNTANGFVEFDGKHLIEHPGLGERLGVRDDQVFDEYQDSDGTMWYCTITGVRAVSAHTGPVRSYGPPHTAVYRIYIAPNGAHWFSGLVGIGKIVDEQMWTPAPGLFARYFYAGKDGDLWIGVSGGGGLVHLQPRTVQMFTKADGSPTDAAMDVLPAHDGRLWVGYNCGLAVFDGTHFRTFDKKDGLNNICAWALAEDRNQDIWVGTWGGGLFRYHDGHFSQFTKEQGLATPVVTQIVVAKDDSLWMVTPDGVSHLQSGRIRNYGTAEGLSSVHVQAIYQDHAGTIWVATLAGVDRLVSDHFVFVPSTRTTDEALPRSFVETAAGDLYTIDLPQGVSQIKNGQVTLLDNTLSLMQMVEGSDHNLWFSSRDGVIRIPEQGFALMGKSNTLLDYEVFNRADGLNTTEASLGTPNIAMTSDGTLWIATGKGLAKIDTLHLPATGQSPRVFVSGVTSDTTRYPVGNGLVLPPGIHHVELNLAAINLANPQRVRLQYRLEGVDSDWLDGTSSRTAIYSNLPAGTHRLLIRATNSIGQWSQPESVYELTQKPYFYAQPLFQLGCAFAMALLLVLAYILRMRYVVRETRVMLEQRQMERETVARELHDTFLQGIQGLILRFHTGTQQLPPDHPVRESFEEALRQSDGVLLEGRSVLSRLRTRRIKPETLTESFTAIGKEFRSLCQAQFDVIVSGQSRGLNVVVQEELQKIGREALFNAYRHAQASQIEVEIHFGLLEFRVRFRDDGVGIDPAILHEGSLPGHYGLPGMRERVSRIGGRMDLWSRVGGGTEIEIRIPGAIAYRHRERQSGLRWFRNLLSQFLSRGKTDSLDPSLRDHHGAATLHKNEEDTVSGELQ
jgi:signal transduction histidine kinase/ligand-binding sensor domain-containing protein